MANTSYEKRRSEVETYFDRTAADAWKKLTSDAPVGRIRRTVREGRDRMRETLLSWLPTDMTGKRLMDAGCGTGRLAVEAARRGAEVIAIDIAPTLIELAKERALNEQLKGSVHFQVGDMFDPALGQFDHIVAMDSLIHYEMDDCIGVLAALSKRTNKSIVFTFAPRTSLLSVMHVVGKLFPHSDRSPAIIPLKEEAFRAKLAAHPDLAGWKIGRTQRIVKGFYISQALELYRP